MKVLNTLNIDTALGAVSFVFIASFIRQVEVEASIYFSLFASVLFIYNLDHLIDAYKLKDENSSFRHSFYQRHFNLLVAWQIMLAIFNLWLLFLLPVQIIVAGLIMTLFMVLYFVLIFYSSANSYLLREVVVALGYTAAILIVPFASFQFDTSLGFYAFAICVFLIALTNLWVFAIYDLDVDKSQGHHSIANRVSKIQLVKLTKILIAITLGLLLGYMYYVQWLIGLVLLVVELMYFLLLNYQSKFSKEELYRTVGEAILILPGLTVLLVYAI